MEVIQSSRFCPASLICQLNEARRNANIFRTAQGKQLVESLESLAKEKLRGLGQSSGSFTSTDVLQKCGLLSNESKRSLVLDISGDGRFVAELLARGVCRREQCGAILCQNSAAQYDDIGIAMVKSCTKYDAGEVEKIRSFGRERVGLDKPQSNNDDDSCENSHEQVLLDLAQEGDDCPSDTQPRFNKPFGNTVESNPKPLRVLLGSVSNPCRPEESSNDDELSSKITLFNQCVTAFRLVEDGDCLVLEMFDTLTQSTVGVIYIFHLIFEEIALVSPGFSPTSKQYLVCRNAVNSNQSTTLLAHTEKVLEVLTSNPPQRDVIGFLPIKELFSEKFYKHIRKHTTNHVKNQLSWIIKCERLVATKNAC